MAMVGTAARPPIPRWAHALAEAALRHPWRLLVPMGALLLAAEAAAWLLPPRYRAAALLRMEWDDGRGSTAQGPDLASRRLDRVRQWTLSESAIRSVLAEMKARPSGLPRPPEVEALRASVAVRAHGQDAILIECRHPDPGEAAFVPNRLARLLLAEADRLRAKREESDPRRVEARLVEARKALVEQEAAVSLERGHRESPPLAGPDADAARRQALEAERSAVELRSAAARGRAARLRDAIVAGSQAPSADENGSEELVRLRAELVEMRRRYTEEHPDVVALAGRIRRLEMQTAAPPPSAPDAGSDRLRSELGQAEAEVEELGRSRERLETAIARLDARDRKSASSPAPGQDRALAGLTRGLEQARAVYRARLEEWRAAQKDWHLGTLASPRFEILHEALRPQQPDFPNRTSFGIVGLCLGLVLGIGSAVSAERRDPSVKSPEDLQSLLPLPLLAEIPLVRVRRSARGRRSPVGDWGPGAATGGRGRA